MAVMRRLTPVEHPADRSRFRWVFDVLVFLVAFFAALPSLFHDGSNPPAGAFPVLFVVLLPLLVRRIYPVPVFVWLLVTCRVAVAGHVVAGLAC